MEIVVPASYHNHEDESSHQDSDDDDNNINGGGHAAHSDWVDESDANPSGDDHEMEDYVWFS